MHERSRDGLTYLLQQVEGHLVHDAGSVASSCSSYELLHVQCEHASSMLLAPYSQLTMKAAG